jgi:hypothetical protein
MLAFLIAPVILKHLIDEIINFGKGFAIIRKMTFQQSTAKVQT